MSHAAAPAEPAFVPGPERVAVLRRVHSFGTAVGMAFWLGFFILLAAGLDGRLRVHRAAQAAAEGLPLADYLGLHELSAGLGLKTLGLLVALGLMFGLSCHQFNRQALEKLSEPHS
jgi:hypothetical protein